MLCMLLALIPDNAAPSFWQRVYDYALIAFTFDFGYSTQFNEEIPALIFERAMNTFLLLVLSVVIALIICIPAGVIAGLSKNSKIQSLLSYPLYFLSTIPVLLWGTLFVFLMFLLLGTNLQFIDLYNADLYDTFLIISLPVLALTIGDGMLYDMYKAVRDEVVNIYSEPWIKGLKSRGRTISGHISRGLVEPLFTAVSSKLTYLISGAIVVEFIFSWEGIGLLLFDAISVPGQKDYPVIIAIVLVFILLVIVTTIIKQFLNLYLNPQLRENR